MANEAVIVLIAALLDATVGEPPLRLHPVVWMGHAIAPLKRAAARTPVVELAHGALYVLLVSGGFALSAWIALRALTAYRPLALALELFLLFSCFALKGLLDAGREMLAALTRDDLAAARRALTSLCSRDPAELGREELAAATIESLCENASDSVVAPLFYYLLFGVPGAVFYRAVNTLDAMVGYRGRYEYLGKVAARLDDVLNLVPARLTALLMLMAAPLLGLPIGRGISVCRRDRQRTESPNAGWPMSMGAGLLGVRLEKRAVYVLGGELPAPTDAALARAITLVQTTGLLAFAACIFLLTARHG
jgi:adenosylcobinamide-phosphate synthase